MNITINIDGTTYTFAVSFLSGDIGSPDAHKMHCAYWIELYARRGQWSGEQETHIAFTTKKYTWAWTTL